MNNNEEKFIIAKQLHFSGRIKEAQNIYLKLSKIYKKNHLLFYLLGTTFLQLKEYNKAIREFEAKVTVLKTHSTSIKKGYEPVLHVSTIRQTAKVLDIYNVIKSKNNPNIKEDETKIVLRTGDKATIRFRFKYRPEYICKDYKILLAEGKVKIVGLVTDLKVTH